ncbi:MAG: excisionase family DNA-binding protein [Candidatus Marinimicrobia bacterium]|nr:excisionase family DNA-binding protein [Candidatus Brocadiales bacterium]MBL7047370.1 excisionase family DNA-binding protein [Candidatus Neomarinimicrobiota bacterium]
MHSGRSVWRTVTEAAEYIGVSTRTIQRYIIESNLQAFTTPSGVIRLNQNDIDAWVMFGLSYRKLTRPQKEQLQELCR